MTVLTFLTVATLGGALLWALTATGGKAVGARLELLCAALPIGFLAVPNPALAT